MIDSKKVLSRLGNPFFRYLLLYILFAMLILATYIPISQFISHSTLQRILEQYQATLSSNADTLDNTISALNNAVAVTYRDPRFRKFRYLNADTNDINQIDFNSLKDLLNGLIIPHNLVADTAILFSDSIVLTRQRSFFNSTFYSYYPDFLSCEQMDYAQWHDMIASSGRLLPAMQYKSTDYGAYEALMYVSAWSDQFPNTGSLFIAALPVQRLISLFVDAEIEKSAYLRISTDNAETLCEYGIDNLDDCRVVSTRTPLWCLTIEFGIPTYVLNEDCAPITQIMWFFGAIVALITLIMILLFAYHSARPIRAILNTMLSGRHTGQALKQQYDNPTLASSRLLREYRALDESLSYLDRRMEDHTRIIDQQQSMLKNQLMDMALRSGLYRPEDINLFQTVFPEFPQQFQLSLFFYEAMDPDVTVSVAQLQFEILAVLREKAPNVYAQGFDGSAILLVLPVGDEREWNDRLGKIREYLSCRYAMPFFFSISEVFKKPQDLIQAYQQIQCLNAFSAYNRYSIIECAETARLRKIQLPLGIGAIQIMHSALSNGNHHIAVNALSECVNAMTEPEDYVLIRHTYTMMANLIVQLKLENPTVLFDVVIPSFDETRRRSEFADRFDACFRQICDLILDARRQNIDGFTLEVMRFIDENLKNLNLCINTVSDRFNISAPTLQKIVKKLSGQTFSAYVEDKRLSDAYALLASGVHSVQAVAEMCGFASSNSFYKVFKRHYGVSPSTVQSGGAGNTETGP